jgi:quercetin dioxygenase-like cupin family protein
MAKPSQTARFITSQDDKVGSISIGKYLAILSTHPPGLLRERHTHDETHLIIVRSGKMSFKVDGQTQEVGPGDIVLIPPGVHHSSEVLCESPSSVMCLVLI